MSGLAHRAIEVLASLALLAVPAARAYAGASCTDACSGPVGQTPCGEFGLGCPPGGGQCIQCRDNNDCQPGGMCDGMGMCIGLPCGPDAGTGPNDAGTVADASAADASVIDGSANDASTTDASTTDASTTDASTTDGSTTDGSVADATEADASATDGAATDASDRDASAFVDGGSGVGGAMDEGGCGCRALDSGGELLGWVLLFAGLCARKLSLKRR